MPFVTKITKARFVWSPLSGEEMAGVTNDVLKVVMTRMREARNCEDAPAKPLKPGRNNRPGYPEWKIKRGIAPLRNWISPIIWPKGRLKLYRALKVTEANPNRAIIKFIDPQTARIAHINNKIEKMFGLSPKDREATKKFVEAAVTAVRRVFVMRIS